MTARDMFRAPANLKLRDGHAGKLLLSCGDKDEDKKETERLIARIAELQAMLYAQRKHKVLLVLQGMDTAGKDGTVRALFSQVNPIGIRVQAFKAPTDIELAHDFLWRIHQQVPVKGEVAIFNRSHYEDVLVPRVLGDIDTRECKRRYAQINDFERMLAEQGTVIVKIFLHISNDEQRGRLQERIDDPDKNWKFDPHDIVQRANWDAFQHAYERAIAATNAGHAPWYVVPADSKTQRNLAVASIVLETLEALKLSWPPANPALRGVRVK